MLGNNATSIFQESDTQIGRPMFGLLAAKFIPHKYEILPILRKYGSAVLLL